MCQNCDQKNMTIQEAASDAIFVQSACNLSGVIHSFSRVMNTLWEEANKIGKSTDWVNQHPICRLFLEQIAYLNGVYIDNTKGSNDYYKAYDECERLAKG